MIEEPGRVVAVEGDEVWVETIQKSACGNCSAKSTCGQGLVANYTSGKRNHIRLVSNQRVQTGDQVILGIPENTLIKSALLAYGLPLLLFVLVAGIADGILGVSEPWVIFSGLAGLIIGFVLVRVFSGAGTRQSSFQPVILKVVPEAEKNVQPVCLS